MSARMGNEREFKLERKRGRKGKRKEVSRI